MNRRKVLISDVINADYMIILTDASPEHIKEWIEQRKADDDYNGDYFKDLRKDNYVNVLYDSNEDLPENEVAIGYTEAYDIHEIERQESFEKGKNKLLIILNNAVQAANMTVIDDDNNGFIVKNNGIGGDFQVTISET